MSSTGMSSDHFSVRPSRRSACTSSTPESVSLQARKPPPGLSLAAVPSNTYKSQPRHFPPPDTKPHSLPPTSSSSVQPANQLTLPKTKPPPVPKRPAKSTSNYYHIDKKSGSIPTSLSVVSCPIHCQESKLTAKHNTATDGSDNYHQSLNKISQTIGEPFLLAEFVSLYQHSLPLRIRVEQGYCGKEERSVISAGDVYNFHFIKNETVLLAEDEGERVFSVPLNSSIKFGLLYHPVTIGDEKKSLREFSYRSIGDLVSCSIPPQVLRATQSFSSGEMVSSVEADEVLIIKEIARTTQHKLYVKAFSLLTHKQKILYDDCKGYFLTDPSGVQLFITEIIEHLKDSLPLKAMLILDSDVSDSRLLSLASEVVTLKQTNVESFIIATTCWDENDAIPDIATQDRDDIIPVAIPTDLKISVTMLGEQSKSESLYEDTRQLYEKFDPSKVYAVCSSDNFGDSIYTPLMQSVRSGYEYQGLEIIKPRKIYSEECCSIPSSTCQMPQQQGQSSQIPTSHVNEQNEASLMSELASELEELKSQLKQALSLISDLADKYDGLQREIMKLKKDAGNVARKPFIAAKGNVSHMERNVKELKTLSCKQIQVLLQTMNFNQYFKKFHDEKIDGQLLSECDENVLQHELGISSAVHRAKLMKIITGRQSAVDILRDRTQAK